LSPLAVELLKALREVTAEASGAPPRWREWVFRAQGFSIGVIGTEAKRVSGLADVSIHDLRRSTASGLQRIGAPPHIISTVLGHAREAGATATDAAYTHDRRVDEHRLWLERWARHVEGLIARAEARASNVVPDQTRPDS
jgi:integrase